MRIYVHFEISATGRTLSISHSVLLLGCQRTTDKHSIHMGGVFVGVFCLLRGGVGFEYGMVSFGLHCFLRLELALCWRSGRCLAGVAFSV